MWQFRIHSGASAFVRVCLAISVGVLPLTGAPAGLASSLSSGPTQGIPPEESALRAAVASGGTIVFITSGIIRLTNEVQIARDTVLDAGGFDVRFEGSANTHLFSVRNANVTLRDLKLINFAVEGAPGVLSHPPINGASIYGGVIFASNANLRVESCLFSNNIARGGKGLSSGLGLPAANGGDAFGGCIFQDGGTLTISFTTFTACSAAGASGAFFLQGSFAAGHDAGGALYVANAALHIEDSLFEGNSAASPASLDEQTDGKGGAIFLTNSPAQIRRTRFLQNQTSTGGAINSDSALTIIASAFDQNEAVGGGSGRSGEKSGRGGAVFSSGVGANISQSTFIRNTAQGGAGTSGGIIFPAGDAVGGAIYLSSGTLNLSNSVVALNATIGGLGEFGAGGGSGRTQGGQAQGGGIFCASAVIDYSTIASNSLSSNNVVITGGGALFSTNGTVSFHASILSQEGQNVLATVEDRGYNLVSDAAPQFTNSTTRTGIDPRLGPFMIPDGLYGYFVPLPDSPAVDAGDPAKYPSVDIRGAARPVGLGPDIGAVEVTPTPTLVVTKNGTNVDLEVTTQSARPALIEASEDLIHWAAVFTSPATQSSFEWPVSSSAPYQFYRVRE